MLTFNRSSPTVAKISGRLLFGIAGWALAATLAVLIVPRVCRRLTVQWPSVQQERWQQIKSGRKAQLATAPWRDSRPLHLLVGDSQIEMGNWYELFGGKFAVRNCGLSSAKIEDVTELVAAIGDRHPHAVVLMCGINNLGGKDPVDVCATHYEKLLATTRSVLQPQKIVVLSVMPVRQSPVDRESQAINQQVAALNERLKELCRAHDAVFLSVNAAISNSDGALANELTGDGLHLNPAGYARIARVIEESLATQTAKP